MRYTKEDRVMSATTTVRDSCHTLGGKTKLCYYTYPHIINTTKYDYR